jgi:hypothetical protein
MSQAIGREKPNRRDVLLFLELGAWTRGRADDLHPDCHPAMPPESDTSSLVSLSDSIRRELYRMQGGRRRQASLPPTEY